MSPAKPDPDKDEPVKIPLDPETALRGLLAVNPDDEPAKDDHDKDGDPE
jgi:hypothetical protein